jgi:Cu2+-exporting ATPase
MLLISALLSGGALIASAKLYQKNKRQEEMPWTVYRQSVGVTKHKTKKWPFKQYNNWLRADQRRQHLNTLSEDDAPVEKQQIERHIDRDLVLTIGTVALAGIGGLGFPFIRLLSLPGILYGFWPIYKEAYHSAIKTRKVELSLFYALVQSVELASGLFFTTALGNLWFLLSHKLMVIAKERYRQNLHHLFEHLPTTVYVLLDGVEVERPLDTLSVDDTIVLRAGEVMPVDGVITHGFATIDQQALTGESQPVEKERGSQVYASTVVLSGYIHVQLEMAGQETMMAQISQILEKTTAIKDSKQTEAEQFSNRAVLPILGLSGLAIPLLGLRGATAILDAHPQYRIIISTPLSTINFLNRSSEQGILVKDGRTFELLTQVDTVVFDKTGTLTLEQPLVSHVHTFVGIAEETVLGYAAAAEKRQSHPIAKAILQEAAARLIDVPAVDDARYQIGYGLTVHLANDLMAENINKYDLNPIIRVGSRRFIEQERIILSEQVNSSVHQAKEQGNSIVLIAVNEQVVGAIELQSAIRPESAAVVQWLKEQGKEIVIISGDYTQPTRVLAEALGIEHYFAETLPEDKGKLIEQLQDDGKRVCFVGDGINDTIAMKKSLVSVSLRGATTAAIDTAQVVLMEANLQQLTALFELAEQHKGNMRLTTGAILSGAATSIIGALFFGTSIQFTALVNQIMFPVSLVSAMWPTLSSRPVKRIGGDTRSRRIIGGR